MDLTQRIANLSLKQRELLELKLKSKKINIDITQPSTILKSLKQLQKNRYSPIKPVEKKEYYPVSSAQKRMFLLNRIKGIHTTSDTIPAVLMVEGKLDMEYLQDVGEQIINRHLILRISFEIRDDQIVQRINQDVDFRIHVMEAREEEIDEVIKTFIRPFDLAAAPLLRVELVRLREEKHLLMYSFHHIITDGTSLRIFERDFIHLYNGLKLPALQIQYHDFAIWQNRQIQLPFIKKQEEYWLKVFPDKESIPVLNMSTDFPRPLVQVFEGNYIDLELSPELTALLRNIITGSGATLYIVLLAIYTILLSKYSDQEDIVVGVPIQGRNHPGLENLLGAFVNTLAIRSFPVGDKTFMDFLGEVKKSCLEAYENQDFQFEELVARLGIQPDPGRQALFSTMFQHFNVNLPEVNGYQAQSIKNDVIEINDLRFKRYEFKNNIIQFDLLLHAFDATDMIKYRLLYSTKLFKEETVKRFMRHLINIAAEVVSNPYIKISDIRMFSPEETEDIMAISTSEIIDNLEIDLEF